MLLERYDEAVTSLDHVLALAPDTVKAHVDRALALHALERNAEALTAIECAIALMPSAAKLHVDRSTLLYHAGASTRRWPRSSMPPRSSRRMRTRCSAAASSRCCAETSPQDGAAMRIARAPAGCATPCPTRAGAVKPTAQPWCCTPNRALAIRSSSLALPRCWPRAAIGWSSWGRRSSSRSSQPSAA